MALFSKKKEDFHTSPNPNQSINEMRNMGLTNNQIIQNMQRDGYNLGQINDSMNQVNMGPITPPGPFPGQQYQMPPQQQMPPQMPSQMPPQMPPSMGYGPQMQMDGDETSAASAQFEEIAEAIIEEKWKDLMKNVNKIVEWKGQVEIRLVQMEQKTNDLQHSYDELHKALISKINDYDQNILNVGSQVKAMEKVFSKVLPSFTDNVNELGRITGYMKTGTKRPSKNDEDEIPHEFLQNL